MPVKLGEEFVKNKLLSLDFELLESYKNSISKISIKCLRHNEVYKSIISSLFRGQRLMCCANEIRRKNKFHTLEEVKDICKNYGFEFMDTWRGSGNKKYFIYCNTHKEQHSVIWDNFIKYRGIKCCSLENKKEGYKKFTGNKSPNWKPQTEEKVTRNENWFYSRSWSWKIRKRDKYICQFCKQQFKPNELNAHHLDTTKIDKETRLDINNGITLCSKHHYEFHLKYSKENNTRKQFEEFCSGEYVAPLLQSVN